MGAVCLFADRAWWLWVVVPLYSLWLGYTTVMGVKGGIPNLGREQQGSDNTGESKRQKKLEKRGGQKVKYR